MLIEEKALQHWVDKFYGYGTWQAKMWFIAYEESGGDLPEEVAEKLTYFLKIHPSAVHADLCDIRDMFLHLSANLSGSKANLFSNLHAYRFGTHAIQNNIWKNLIAFVHGYRNQSLPDLLAYQKKSFLSPSNRNEALLVLYPLPSPHNHAWYYSWLDLPGLEFLKSRSSYQEHVFPNRIHHLLHQISIYKPEVVLMYGMDNIATIKKSIQEFFPGVTFQTVKGAKLQIPQHHRADFDNTTLLLTTQIPTLRHNRIETGFDWHLFGNKVSE